MLPTDEDILRRCADGDGTGALAAAGFRVLYTAYEGRVRATLYRLCDQTDLNDLVQETFLKIWNALPAFKRDCALKTWIYRIAVNVAYDHRRARRRKGWLTLAGDALEETAAEPPASAVTELERQEVRDAIQSLPPKLRHVVVLHSLEDVDVQEIAAILEIPAGTVKSRLFQARQRLKRHIERARAQHE